MKQVLCCAVLGLLCVCGLARAQLLGTAFTYQGAPKENDTPASGQYDFEFVLFSGVSGGSQLTAAATSRTTKLPWPGARMTVRSSPMRATMAECA